MFCVGGVKAKYSVMAGGFEAKCAALEKLYRVLDVGQTCIFVNQRAVADQLGEWMRSKGHVVEVLHGGDMDLKKRETTLQAFREGKTKVLISTDVLARGIDVMDVTLVVNFDLPMDGKKFVGVGAQNARNRIRKRCCIDREERGEWGRKACR